MTKKPTYEALEQRVWELKKEALENKQTEHSLVKINTCLLSLGRYFTENVNRITSLSGELFGATCALYNRLDGGMLCSIGQWQTPPDYDPVDKPDGHICYDVIQRGVDDVFIVQDLQNSIYAQSDPNVVTYSLETYVGHPVKFNGQYIGSLCVVFQSDYFPSEKDKLIIGILASAISEEEKSKQAEEALHESEEQYRLLVKNLPSVVYQGYKDWSVNFFDRKIELLTGYNFDVFNSKQMKWSDIIFKEDIETARESFIQALKSDKSYVREYRIKSKAGDLHWIQERGQIVCDSKGEVEYVSGVFFDITERKKAEEEKEKLISELQTALAEVKTLSGLLPICASCKKIRDDKGYWNQIESYIQYRSEAEFSHGICPDCFKTLYSDLDIYD